MSKGGSSEVSWLAGGGEMGELVRAYDWSRTPLGPIAAWPQSLRTTVSLCLSSTFPMNIIWGPESTQIYNDGYRVVCGDVHPRALGEDYRVTWASAWPAIGESFDSAWAGKRMFLENQRMFLKRLNGSDLEETFFTFSHSPIQDESGRVGGLFHPVTETTANMLAERRTRALRDLAANLAAASDEADIARRTVDTLTRFEFDLPFVGYYILDPQSGRYRLAGHFGIAADLISQAAGHDGPLQATFAQAASGSAIVEIGDLTAILQGAPCGPYEEPPDRGFVIPIAVPAADRAPALIVTAASSRLPFTPDYRSFYDLLGVTIAGVLATVRVREDERRRAEALAEIDRAKTLFFSNVSHEFRTPLTLMLGPLEEALAGAQLPEDERERLDVAHRNALRLLKLVNSLLDFSRMEAGRAQVSYAPVDLAALTTELASNFRSACARAGLGLSVDCPPLPEPVHVDRDMWEKIVLNLLSNAFKFTFEGEIAIRLRAAKGQAELTVRDTGVGIPQAELPRLFERFHRIEGQKSRTYEGSGIGLALVQELVRLHSGAIGVESAPGSGTAFTVTVPLGTDHLPKERIGAATSLAPSAIRADAWVQEALRWLDDEPPRDAAPESGMLVEPAGAAVRASVLLADDNADMRAYVRRLLEPWCDVEAVADGEAALALIRARRPDLLIADVMMPGLDGFGLLRAIRGDHALRDIPVIMLSARAGEESRVEGLEAGADDYLVKPFSARELTVRVGAYLQLSRLRREVTATLRESEERKAFLLKLGDTMRPLADPAAIMAAASEALGRQLQVGRCGYGEVDVSGDFFVVERDWTDGAMPSLSGRFRLDAFGPYLIAAARKGETVVIDDAYADRRARGRQASFDAIGGVRASLAVPLMKEGRWVAALYVQHNLPRRWSAADEELVREVAERTWAAVERARAEAALRRSEQATRRALAYAEATLRTSPIPLLVLERDLRVHSGNDAFYETFRVSRSETEGRLVYDLGNGQWNIPRLRELLEEILPNRTVLKGVEVAHRFDAIGQRVMLLNARRMDVEPDSVERIILVIEDITERKQTELALLESEARFRTMADNISQLAWTCDRLGEVNWYNRRWMDYTGLSFEEMRGWGWQKVQHPDHADRVLAGVLSARESGEPWEDTYPLRGRDGEYRWFLSRAVPIHDADGAIIRWFGTNTDVTEQRKAEEARRMLTRELSHRVKNMLATVQAIATQTLRHNKDPVEFVSSFGGRIRSMSRVHEILSESDWQGAELHQVIRDQLFSGAVDETRVTVTGPAVQFDAQMVPQVGMMLHELGTNSIKYGALSTADGTIAIRWMVDEEMLHLSWTETGGPHLTAPVLRGFGLSLIEQSAKSAGGAARMSIAAQGIGWDITMPLPAAGPARPEAGASSGAHPVAAAATPDAGATGGGVAEGSTTGGGVAGGRAPLAGRRILIVEDEPLVGLEILASLEEAGAQVVGPAGDSKSALALIEGERLDAALLDANLQGHPVDDIAAALTRKNVPFAFVSGYGRDGLPASFARAPLLTKPFSPQQLVEAASGILRHGKTVSALSGRGSGRRDRSGRNPA